MMRTIFCVAFLALVCPHFQSAATSASLTLPPAIQNGFRIGASQPNAQGTAGFSIQGLGFDVAGNMYLAGTNMGGPFAVSNQTSIGLPGEADLFVMKLSAAGRQVVYVTRIGGSGADQFGGMAVDRDGNVYLAGSTWSLDFPTTANSYLPKITQPGSFVLKLDVSGQKLLYSTHLAPQSQAYSVAIDNAGNAYVAGSAYGKFPTTPGAYQQVPVSPGFGFVTKLSPDGRSLLFSTTLGGSAGGDYVQSIALEPNGVIHLAGRASSPDFPTTPGANRNVRVPGLAVFLARLDNTGSRLLYSTLLYDIQNAGGLAVDSLGDSYVAGGPLDFKATKIDAHGTLVYAKTFDGAHVDSLNALMALDDGTLLLGGASFSPDFPTRDSLQPCTYNLPPDPSAVFPPGGNAVFMMLDPAGNLVHSSLLGGVGDNSIGAMARDPGGSLYLAGYTTAFGFPGTRELIPGPPFIDTWGFVFTLDLSAIVRGRPAPSCVVHGGTYAAGEIAPGMVASIFGSNLGPNAGVGFTLGADGNVPTVLAGIHVTVGGTSAPILYAQDRQINFVMPQQVAGKSTNICVGDVQAQSCLSASVVSSNAGIFGAGSAVLNQDGTLNTPANPAVRGSVISFFGTGMGPYDRLVPDGSIAAPPLSRLQYPIGVSFYDPTPSVCFFHICSTPLGPFSGEALYAGQAPELVAGVTQVNVKVPQDAIPGANVRVTLTVSGPSSNSVASATVALK
jgi:uncharacterized protein (TIGR03437 family)